MGVTDLMKDYMKQECPFSHHTLLQDVQNDLMQSENRYEPDLETTFHKSGSEDAVYPLYSPAMIDNHDTYEILPEDWVPLEHILRWTREFIMLPHPNLGRTGSVCPFVQPSIKEGLLFLSACHLEDPTDMQEIYRKIYRYRDIFRRIPVTSEDLEKYKAVMIVFPDMTDAMAVQFMEPLHQRIKTELLQDGLLIGQFYPSCPVPGTWNPFFYPLQSPLPMLVIRNLIETDWRFLEGNPSWEKAYHTYFLQHLVVSKP